MPRPAPPISTVKVVNPQSEPVPVLGVPRQPVQQTYIVAPVQKQSFTQKLYTVPAAKRLVIEYVFAQGQLAQGPADEVVAAIVGRTSSGGAFGGAAAWIPLTKHGWFAGRGTMFVGASPARIYCSPDPPHEVYCYLIFNEAASARFEIGFSGHLIDA